MTSVIPAGSPVAQEPTNRINPELNNIFSDIDQLGSGQEEKKADPKVGGYLAKDAAKAFQRMSVIAHRKTGLKSVLLSEEDERELADAIAPLMDDLAKYIDILPYIPLVLFVVAYAIGIVSEVMQKRKEPQEREDRRVERIAPQERYEPSARIVPQQSTSQYTTQVSTNIPQFTQPIQTQPVQQSPATVSQEPPKGNSSATITV